MKLQGIRLLVEDFDAMFHFFSEVMELEVGWGKPGDVYGSFKINGEVAFAIFQADLMDKALDITVNQPRRMADTSVIVLEMDEIDTMTEHLKRKGIQFVTEPHDMPEWGNRCAHFRDPEGNLYEMSTSLAVDKWDDDLKEAAKEYNKID